MKKPFTCEAKQYPNLFTNPAARTLAKWARHHFVMRNRNLQLAKEIKSALNDRKTGTVIVPWGADHFAEEENSLFSLGSLRIEDFTIIERKQIPVLKCASGPGEPDLQNLQRGILCFKHLSEGSKNAVREAQREKVQVQRAERLTQLSDPSWFTEPIVKNDGAKTQVRINYTNSSKFERLDSILCAINAYFYGEENSDGSVPIREFSRTFLVTSVQSKIVKDFRRPRGAVRLVLSMKCDLHPAVRDLGHYDLSSQSP